MGFERAEQFNRASLVMVSLCAGLISVLKGVFFVLWFSLLVRKRSGRKTSVCISTRNTRTR